MTPIALAVLATAALLAGCAAPRGPDADARAAAPAQEATNAPALSVAEQATLGALLGRLDQALGDDGQLL